MVILAAVLRFSNLGYSEFQGDEGVIMMRAASAITGDEGEIFLHQKGPVEILLPSGIWGLAGQINELWARLPFAWAGILAVAAVARLGQRWTGTKAGVVAGTLLALTGFGVAFGRIVQYQGLVMLWGTLAVLYADRYASDGGRYDLLLTAVFLAGGLLAHYDAILAAPAVGWLLVRRLRYFPIDWRAWGTAVLTGRRGSGAVLRAFFAQSQLRPHRAISMASAIGRRPRKWPV